MTKSQSVIAPMHRGDPVVYALNGIPGQARNDTAIFLTLVILKLILYLIYINHLTNN
jgi:hypothetical protein